MKVISGFQSGADIAGVMAAFDLGIQTGGWMPKGFKTEKGDRPDYVSMGAQQMNTVDYISRTKKNIDVSDVTLVFALKPSVGSNMTVYYCNTHKWDQQENNTVYVYPRVQGERHRPCMLITKNASTKSDDEVASSIFEFLKRHKPRIINVAGNRESVSSEVNGYTYRIMRLVLLLYKAYLNKTNVHGRDDD